MFNSFGIHSIAYYNKMSKRLQLIARKNYRWVIEKFLSVALTFFAPYRISTPCPHVIKLIKFYSLFHAFPPPHFFSLIKLILSINIVRNKINKINQIIPVTPNRNRDIRVSFHICVINRCFDLFISLFIFVLHIASVWRLLIKLYDSHFIARRCIFCRVAENQTRWSKLR